MKTRWRRQASSWMILCGVGLWGCALAATGRPGEEARNSLVRSPWTNNLHEFVKEEGKPTEEDEDAAASAWGSENRLRTQEESSLIDGAMLPGETTTSGEVFSVGSFGEEDWAQRVLAAGCLKQPPQGKPSAKQHVETLEQELEDLLAARERVREKWGRGIVLWPFGTGPSPEANQMLRSWFGRTLGGVDEEPKEGRSEIAVPGNEQSNGGVPLIFRELPRWIERPKH